MVVMETNTEDTVVEATEATAVEATEDMEVTDTKMVILQVNIKFKMNVNICKN